MNAITQPHSKPLWKRINKLFSLLVIIPTLTSIIYFGLIASDVYISNAKFVIYSPQTPTSTGGLTGLLQGVGIGSDSSSAAYAVHDYLLSRSALQALQTKLDYQRLVSQKNIDPFDRFGGWIWFDTAFEQLYRYYKQKVEVNVDTTSNISTITVHAFTPTDAAKINAELITLAQTLVLRMNVRANQNAVAFYKREVTQSEKQLQAAALALANYRNRSRVFNPAPQANLNAQLISKLQDRQITAQVQLGQLQFSSPHNPQISTLKKGIEEIRKEIVRQSTAVVGNTKSLASKSVAFENLSLNKDVAEKRLAASLSALEQARVQAQKQQFFIETIVAPNLPDEALEPRRWQGVLATLVVGLLLWGVFSVIFAGIREHHER